MSNKKFVSLIFLLFGLSMIYAGVQEIHILSSDYNPIFNIRPGSETRAFLILGIASAVSGFVGLIRRKIIEF